MKKYLVKVLNVIGDDHSSGDFLFESFTIEAKTLDSAYSMIYSLEDSLAVKHGQEIICNVKLVV